MKAVVYDRYGSPDVLRVDDVPVPVPGPNQVLVEVVATSVNLSDWESLRGSPAYVRLGGLRTPARRILGSDISGRVHAVGSEVTGFAPGDEVYGEAPMGGFAQFALARESALIHKPEALTFAEASTIPQAGAIALQGTAGIAPGSRVLINGAGGGSGSFAIQLAKRAGAHVAAVDNAGKLEYMRALGADEVFDYTRRDFTSLPPSDHVLDMVATRSAFAVRRALAPGGRYLCVGGPVPNLLQLVTVGVLIARASGRRIGLLMVKSGPEHFAPLTDLCLAGEVTVNIDRRFALEAVAEALAYHGAGRALGKVVVEIGRP